MPMALRLRQLLIKGPRRNERGREWALASPHDVPQALDVDKIDGGDLQRIGLEGPLVGRAENRNEIMFTQA
jgi:uncharacterized Fe-S cluster-containing radical SAM superfamily protein